MKQHLQSEYLGHGVGGEEARGELLEFWWLSQPGQHSETSMLAKKRFFTKISLRLLNKPRFHRLKVKATSLGM